MAMTILIISLFPIPSPMAIIASQLEDNPVLKINFYHLLEPPDCVDTVLQRLALFRNTYPGILVQKIALEGRDRVSLWSKGEAHLLSRTIKVISFSGKAWAG